MSQDNLSKAKVEEAEVMIGYCLSGMVAFFSTVFVFLWVVSFPIDPSQITLIARVPVWVVSVIGIIGMISSIAMEYFEPQDYYYGNTVLSGDRELH